MRTDVFRAPLLVAACLLGLAAVAQPAPAWGKALGYVEVPPLQWPSLPAPTQQPRPPGVEIYAGFYADGMITGSAIDLVWEGNRDFRMTGRLGRADQSPPFVVGITCEENGLCRLNQIYSIPAHVCRDLTVRLLPYRRITMVDPCRFGTIPFR